MDAYAEAKARILDNQVPSDYAILNAADPYCRKFAERGAARRIWFSSAADADTEYRLSDGALWHGAEKIMSAGDVPIRGRHNLENTMAAIAAADLAADGAGVPMRAIAEAVEQFSRRGASAGIRAPREWRGFL